jgi:hypothetical protein|tara:strand:+ start:1198 stop:1596 length:399 start_codon:yes stop_codon:yes gene_type:complete
MDGRDIVRSTMRRGFRAYFSACMPSTATTAMVEIATAEIAAETRMPWGYRRRRARSHCQSPVPTKPVKGFFYHFCEGDGLPDCAVCFEAISSCQKVISLRCSNVSHHSFHEDCITPWLKDKGTCPVCRAEIL